MKDTPDKSVSSANSEPELSQQKATPLRCFVASIISGGIAWFLRGFFLNGSVIF